MQAHWEGMQQGSLCSRKHGLWGATKAPVAPWGWQSGQPGGSGDILVFLPAPLPLYCNTARKRSRGRVSLKWVLHQTRCYCRGATAALILQKSREAAACSHGADSTPHRSLAGLIWPNLTANSLREPGLPPAPGVHSAIGVTSRPSTPLVSSKQGAGAEQVIQLLSN